MTTQMEIKLRDIIKCTGDVTIDILQPDGKTCIQKNFENFEEARAEILALENITTVFF